VHSQNDHEVKALIVEDELDICYLLTGILKKKNLQSSYVNNISQAKEALARLHPYILFIDNHLPDGLGVNFIQEVKHDYPETKIVMITAHDTSDDMQKALTKGADRFIGKPFSRESIYTAVDSLIH
jgi:two-component system, OmpR family, response regulator